MGNSYKTKYGIECSQTWESLEKKSTSCSYCKGCNKDVIDFTGWERKDILKHYKDQPQTCGYFNLNQVDPSMVEFTLPEVKKYFKISIAASLLLSTSVAAQDSLKQSVQHEQLENKSNSDSASIVRQTCVSAIIRDAENKNKEEKVAEDKNKRTKYYLSRRFPFIHKRRLRYVMGCPSF
ncbi:MAG: hypothetical protein NT150_07725 [Bacteroidetes bacterium]|nr:hypothetical protein [Bacteroidota bacterium]